MAAILCSKYRKPGNLMRLVPGFMRLKSPSPYSSSTAMELFTGESFQGLTVGTIVQDLAPVGVDRKCICMAASEVQLVVTLPIMRMVISSSPD